MIEFKVNNEFELYDIHELSGSHANTIACLNSPRTIAIRSNVVYQLRKLNMIIMCHVMFCTLASDLRELTFLPLDGSGTMLSSDTEDLVSDLISIPTYIEDFH